LNYYLSAKVLIFKPMNLQKGRREIVHFKVEVSNINC
jgi:hypothetical protein